MRSVQFEYVLKGVFLGLWTFVGLRQDPANPSWNDLLRVVAWMSGGLGIGLCVSCIWQLVRGYRPGANPVGFLILVLLEGSFWIYLGIVGGLAAGILDDRPDTSNPHDYWLGYCAVGGAVLGFGFYQLRQVKAWTWRFGLAAAMGALLVAVAIFSIDSPDRLNITDQTARHTLGYFVLLGLPFFYLLTFCGDAEESEIEIAALCAAMALGFWLTQAAKGTFEGVCFLGPALLYFVYSTRWLPGLKVFKHTLRGYGHLHVGRIRDALASFRRAREINPKSQLATDGLWELHKRVDIQSLANDPAALELLDYGFCLDRAGTLLIGSGTPTAKARAEADGMLELVARQKPDTAARVDYLRAVSQTHAKHFDTAADTLRRLLDPETPYDARLRKSVLFPAWDLALRLHPELVSRLGEAEVAKPGRRIEAIGAVERILRNAPDDPSAVELKRLLYANLTEPEFVSAAASGPPTDFNYDYVEQLGLALVDDADPGQKARGKAFLRIAGRGLPDRGPAIFRKLADATDDPDEARGYKEQVKRAGVTVGPKNLAPDMRATYFQTLSELVTDADARGDYDAAIGDLRLYMENGKNELDGYRKLAGLYEKNRDPLNALLMTETGLIYNGKDPDFLAKKDKYYYSVEPDRLEKVRDKVQGYFDVDYCVGKATQILSQKEPDLDTLDWGYHLVTLAGVVKPKHAGVMVAKARLLLRKGDRQDGIRILEDVREIPKSKVDDEEAWYTATRILGDLYLNELERPDLAVQCFLDFKDHQKAGADTLYKIAQCYEAMKEPKKAIQFYETVTAYEGHPKYWDATEAVRRLKEGTTAT
ncbi:MAG TPA: tetratricopeptide repeat protein [Fimbriiglobus sp.]|jgi:tetratricopeptide (TPR) repeat protein